MKKILTVITLLACSVLLMARPAQKGIVKYTQPDGSVISILLHGDEWGHWVTDTEGRILEMDEEGYYRIAQGVSEEQVASQAATQRRARRQAMQQRAQAQGHVAVGQKHFLVILVEFKDKAFTTSNVQQEVINMLNQQGYSKNGATGSARDFYYDSSNGFFEPIFDVYGPVTLSKNMSSYGGNDSNGNDKDAEGAVAEGCKLLDSQVNFSNYDNDGDGKVDMVFMLYAGYGEADGGAANTIWPHMYYLSYANINLSLDGKKIDKYACANELAYSGPLADKLDGIGAVCHEFGHTMGLPDFYDSDYTTNGNAGGLYDFSTMCSGTYNNASRTPPYFNTEERILLGWLDADAVPEFPKNGSVTMEAYRPELDKTAAYKIPTDMEGEYFVLECRGNQSWDAGLSGQGLLAYHVDKSSREITLWKGTQYQQNVRACDLWNYWENYNGINENGNHPCFYTIVSSDPSNLNYAPHYYSGYGYYYSEDGQDVVFPGSKNVTTYAPTSWNKVNTAVTLSDIAYANGLATFTVSGVQEQGGEEETSLMNYPYIANPGKGTYTAGEPFELALVLPKDYTTESVSWYVDGVAVEGPSVTLAAGTHQIEAWVTIGDNKRDVVTLDIKVQ